MATVEVIGALYNEEQQWVEVAKEVTRDDGIVEYDCQSIPRGALQHRAAALDIDDADAVIDHILFEPFVPVAGAPGLKSKADRDAFVQRVRDAKVTLAPTRRNGNGVNNAALKARMRAVGIDQRFIDAADADYHQVIREACPFDPEVIQELRKQVQRSRVIAATQAPHGVDKMTAANRLAQKQQRQQEVRRPVDEKEPAARKQKRGELPTIILGR
jgi:hypothetical protein